MALKAVVTTLDGMPPDVAKEYTKGADGKFVLGVEAVDGMALENVTGLRNALAATRTERDEATARLKPFEGLDPLKAKEAITKVGEMATWTPEQKVQEQIKAHGDQLATKHKAELEALKGELTQATTQMQKMLIINVATTALAREKGAAELLLPIIERQTRVRKVGDRYIPEVLDSKGNVRVSPTAGRDGDMTVDELVLELKKDPAYARAFDGASASGSGAGNGNGASQKANQSGKKTISASDKAALEANLDGLADGTVEVVSDSAN